MRRLTAAAAKAISWVSLAVIAMMMFLTTGDVGGRYLFSQPIAASKDITELLLVVAVFMGISYTQVIKGHVRVELMISRLSGHAQAILNTCTSFIATVVFALITWQLGKRAWVALNDPGFYKTETIEIPTGPFMLIAAIGCFVLFLVLITDFLHSLDRSVRGERSDALPEKS